LSDPSRGPAPRQLPGPATLERVQPGAAARHRAATQRFKGTKLSRMRFAVETSEADWVQRNRLADRPEVCRRVGDEVSSGYRKYLRLLHPAYDELDTVMSWQMVAELNGAVFQRHSHAARRAGDNRPGVTLPTCSPGPLLAASAPPRSPSSPGDTPTSAKTVKCLGARRSPRPRSCARSVKERGEDGVDLVGGQQGGSVAEAG
jgi:hypothetical protein